MVNYTFRSIRPLCSPLSSLLKINLFQALAQSTMPSIRSGAAHHCKKAFQMGLSLFRRGFNPSKCKTMAKMAVARMKLLKNKREVVIKQMRRDIAMLLESGQDATARIRVEHVIREQNVMAANELIELFCELVVARLSIIAKQRECPADLKEGISSVIFAAPRSSDIPELLCIRDVFQKKYGKDFVCAATDLRPNAGVNRMLIEKLSVRTPPGEIKLKVLKEIAKEYQVQWDTTESEEELLKPPQDRIEGPEKFVSATSLPIYPTSDREQSNNVIKTFQDLASAAGAAAEKSLAAAEAAAAIAAAAYNHGGVNDDISHNNSSPPRTMKTKTSSKYSPSVDDDESRKMFRRRQSYNCERENDDCDEEIEMEEPPRRMIATRRHSYNVPPAQSQDIKFDDSDEEEEDNNSEELNEQQHTGGRGGASRPPNRTAPQVPARRVHPKLPNYDALAARFEALKHHNPHTNK